MATLKSHDVPVKWTAEALLFSGRRNPTWTVEVSDARRLEEAWDSAEASAPPSPPPALGYRGCTLQDEQGFRWTAGRGVIARESKTGIEHRADAGRTFERSLLRTAPAGVLPVPFLPPELSI